MVPSCQAPQINYMRMARWSTKLSVSQQSYLHCSRLQLLSASTISAPTDSNYCHLQLLLTQTIVSSNYCHRIRAQQPNKKKENPINALNSLLPRMP